MSVWGGEKHTHGSSSSAHWSSSQPKAQEIWTLFTAPLEAFSETEDKSFVMGLR